jgi:hypothetical protein
MNTRNRQQIARSILVIAFVAAGSACDSGYKQIGALDDGATTTTYGGEPDGGGELECTEQDIDVEAHFEPSIEQDLFLTCAANVAPSVDGWLVTLTQCTNEEGQPDVDREVHLTGDDWPEPELADGDQPLHEVRYLLQDGEVGGHGAHVLILRTLDHQRVSLLVLEGTQLLVDPNDLVPLWLSLDEAACTAGPLPCTPETMYQEFPVGFAVGYGDAFANVGHDMMIADLGIDEGANTVYDVLVGFAVTHECYDDGDFRELQLGIVARTVGDP